MVLSSTNSLYLYSRHRYATFDRRSGYRKQAIREAAHANRKAQPDKDAVSTRIVDSFMQLPEYAAAKTVMFYVDVRDEVRTRHALPTAIQGDKRIVIPFCVDGELELFHLESMDELSVGMYKILEPRVELRDVAAKRLQPEDLDLIMVPVSPSTSKVAAPVTARVTTTNCSNTLDAIAR